MNDTIHKINKSEIKQRQQGSKDIFKIEQLRFFEKHSNPPKNRYTKKNKTNHRKHIKNHTKILIHRTKNCIVQTHTLEKYFFFKKIEMNYLKRDR